MGASRADFKRGLFSASDFPLPPDRTQGDLGRNTFDHPGYATVDFQVMTEGADLQIRLEALNALDRTNLTPVIHNLTSPPFGRSTGSVLPCKVTAGIQIGF